MSDVTVAPPGGAPAAAPNQVVIDQNPVSVPTPVGAQAPDKPVENVQGSPHRPQSRREAIQAAFDRATKQQDEGAQRPPQRREQPRERPAAEAKPGHNNPPAEKTEKPIQPGQRGQVGQGQPSTQHREAGRFARAPDAQQGQQAQPRQVQNTLPNHAPYREPLPRFRDQAKNEWHAAPESVRGEVYRMAQEFDGAYKRYQADTEALKPIRRFHEMAQQQGTTLERALNNYVSMEQKLRSDPIAGLDVIVNNLNLKGPDGQKLGLRDVAYHVLNQTPDQLRMVQQGNQQQAAANQIGQLHQEVAGLKNYLQQMHTQQQFTYTRSAVDQYADKHPRFDELGDLIEQELKLGFDLDTAYKRAELLRPATLAAQTRNPSAQTRQADRSISGAPDGGGPSNGSASSQRRGPPPSRRDAIQNAIRRVNGV